MFAVAKIGLSKTFGRIAPLPVDKKPKKVSAPSISVSLIITTAMDALSVPEMTN